MPLKDQSTEPLLHDTDEMDESDVPPPAYSFRAPQSTASPTPASTTVVGTSPSSQPSTLHSQAYTPPAPMNAQSSKSTSNPTRIAPLAINCCGHADAFTHACCTINCCGSSSQVVAACLGINLCGSESLLEKSCCGVNLCGSKSLLRIACCSLNLCGSIGDLVYACCGGDLCGRRAAKVKEACCTVNCCWDDGGE